MSLLTNRANPAANRGQIVSTLCQQWNVSVDEVDGLYGEELARLSEQARIRQFLVTLAVRNTRMALQKRYGHHASPKASLSGPSHAS
jgi:Protein of unknown function (DUF3562)